VVIESADFEIDTESHVAWYGAGVIRSTLYPISGAASLRVETTAAYGSAVQLNVWPGYGSVRGGQNYDVSLRYRSDPAMPTVNWNITWSAASGSAVRTDVIPIPNATTDTTVRRQLVAPEGATHVRWTFTWRVDGTMRPIFHMDDLLIKAT
jgi:hypothetical protein